MQLDGRLQQMKWDAHAAALSAFLVTEVGPPIYYAPRKHNDATRAKLEQQQLLRLAKLAGSALLKEDPLEGIDLSAEPPPPPAAAPAAEAGAEGATEGATEGAPAAAAMEEDGDEPKAAAPKPAPEPEPEPAEVEEPMMEGTELGAMLESN